MDPLSISASLVALIGAANAASHGIQKLIRLKEVPEILLALNNEVSDLQLLLNEVDRVLDEARSIHSASPGSTERKTSGFQSLPPIIERIQGKLANLDSILTRLPANGLTFTKKVLWLRAEPNVVKIRNDLAGLKQSLNTALGLLTSSTALRVHVELQALRVATIQGRLDYTQTTTELDSSEKSIAMRSLNHSEKGFEKIEQQLLALTKQIQQQQVTPPPAYSEKNPWESSLGEKRDQAPPRTTAFGALQMRFSQRRQCHTWCKCACHREGNIKTPRLLNSVMGMMSVGYSGIAALSPKCDSNVCKGNSEGLLQVHYYFPPWFLAKMVSVALGVSRGYGPELCLRVANVRPDWVDIFRHCYTNDVESVRTMLVNGEASVLDVDAGNGNSLLHHAMIKGNFEVMELLIQFGAEPHMENQSKESCYDMAWNSILCFQGTSQESQWQVPSLLRIYPNADACVGRRKLTQTHKIVLDMLHIPPAQEIAQHPTLLDAPDADGRTPLHWAAARGNASAVQLLLSHGANPNSPDFILQGPLRASLKADSPACMELLLASGAAVDQRDNWGQTCLLACMYYDYPEAFVPALITAGADVDARDIFGHAPLWEAIKNGHAAAVRILLRHGASIGKAVDGNGIPALHVGVQNNACGAVAVLLERRFDIAGVDDEGRSVLHYAAAYAGLGMLRVLARARMRGMGPGTRDLAGNTPGELAHRRVEAERATNAIADAEAKGGDIGANFGEKGGEEQEKSEKSEGRMTEAEIEDWETAFAELLLSVSVPWRVKAGKGMMAGVVEAEGSDSDDTTSFHSAIDHFAELGIL